MDDYEIGNDERQYFLRYSLNGDARQYYNKITEKRATRLAIIKSLEARYGSEDKQEEIISRLTQLRIEDCRIDDHDDHAALDRLVEK